MDNRISASPCFFAYPIAVLMLQVKVDPEQEQYRHLLENIAEYFPKHGVTIYKDRNEIKVVDYQGARLNIKKFAEPNLLNRFVYRRLREPKAVRAYEYAQKLHQLGIPTPRPVGYLVEMSPLSVGCSYLVTHQSSYRYTMDKVAEGKASDHADLTRAFARFTADLHRKGVLHLDYSPGNILCDKVGGEWRFELVDINRLRFGEVSLEEGCKSLARLEGDREFFELLATEYAMAMGVREDEVLSLIKEYYKQFWRSRSIRWGIKAKLGLRVPSDKKNRMPF